MMGGEKEQEWETHSQCNTTISCLFLAGLAAHTKQTALLVLAARFFLNSRETDRG